MIVVPFSGWVASLLGIPAALFWDHMSIGIVLGGALIRFGCVCNECCGGKESQGGLRSASTIHRAFTSAVYPSKGSRSDGGSSPVLGFSGCGQRAFLPGVMP
ncbi:MAG: hypothetical protein ACRED0_01060 [Gammaproteobacteria bacterium]